MQRTPPDGAVRADSPLEQRMALGARQRERLLFVVARNLIPIIGILFLGWSAQNLIVVYFADTLGAMWALISALGLYFSGVNLAQPWWQRLNTLVGILITSLFFVAFLALPLGVPLLIVLSISNWSYTDALADTTFVYGLLTIAALSLIGLLRHLLTIRQVTLERSSIRTEFAIVFTRWIIVLLLIYNLALFFGNLAAYLLVIGYVAATVASEIAPERFANLFGADKRAGMHK